MTSDDRTDHHSESAPADALIARVLRAAGPRRELPAALAARWRASFTDELLAIARRRRRRRWFGAAAMAAALAAVSFGALLLDRTTTKAPSAVVAQVVHATGTSGDEHGADVAAGSEWRVGATLHTGRDGYLGIAYRNADVRLGRDSVLTIGEATLELTRGSLYVDTGVSGVAPAIPIVVETPWGTLSHVGTQFLVEASDTALVAAVREGAIALRAARAQRQVSARPGRAAVLTVGAHGITSEFESIMDARWRWIESATPGLAIAGQSAFDALTWAARESGRALVFDAPAAKAHAQSTRLASNETARATSLDDVLVIVRHLTRLRITDGDDHAIHVSLEST